MKITCINRKVIRDWYSSYFKKIITSHSNTFFPKYSVISRETVSMFTGLTVRLSQTNKIPKILINIQLRISFKKRQLGRLWSSVWTRTLNSSFSSQKSVFCKQLDSRLKKTNIINRNWKRSYHHFTRKEWQYYWAIQKMKRLSQISYQVLWKISILAK